MDRTEADAEEDGVVLGFETIEHFGVDGRIHVELDAEVSDAIDLAKTGGECELVLGDTIGVEAAGESVGVVDDGADAVAAKLGSARERRWTSADEYDRLSGVGSRCEWQRRFAVGDGFHRETLQAADGDGLLVVAMQNAGTFAKDIHGTGARAALAENVGIEDGLGGAFEVVGGDLLDEARDVDVRGASSGTGCVEAVEATIGFSHSRRLVEGRMQIRKARSNFRTSRTLLEEGPRITH